MEPINISSIILPILPIIYRLAIIVFSTLGVVYMIGRLLFEKRMGDRGKNIVAFFALIVLSFSITLVYDYGAYVKSGEPYFWKYVADSLIYATCGAVFYVVIGWRFYSRMDALLDRKIGKDDRRKQGGKK